MGSVPDPDVLRDQLLNILLAARDTVSSIHIDWVSSHSSGVLIPRVGFRRQLCYLTWYTFLPCIRMS